MDYPFAALTPDLGETAGMQIADSVLPRINGWGPHPSLFVASTAAALPGPPRGVFSVVLNSGAWSAYELTASTLYQLQSDFTLTSIATDYACPTGFDWSAIHFGTKLLFTNTFDGLHAYDVEAGGAVTYISKAGDPAYIFSCANFVVALNCKDNNGNRDARLIKTSGINDQTNWTTEGADYQELADGESLVAGFNLSDNQAILLQTRALVLMTFGNATGGAQFSLQKVADGKGSVGARSCVSFGGIVFFLDTDDFYMYTVAGGLKPIGLNAICDWFLSQVDQANFALIQASVDPLKKIVRWIYKRSIDSSTTVFQVGIGYNWAIGRWFTFTTPLSYLARLATVAVSYDSASGTYDSQTLIYDDRFWTGQQPLSGGLDQNYKFGVFSGTSLGATFKGPVINNPVSGKILRVTPDTDSANVTVQVGSKDTLSAATTLGEVNTVLESGIVPLYDRGLNIQFNVTIPAGDVTGSGAAWSRINGLDHIQGINGGPR